MSKWDNRFVKWYKVFSFILKSIFFFFFLGAIACMVTLFCTAMGKIFIPLIEHKELSPDNVIVAVEKIFLSPLPLLVVYAFYTYSKKIIIPELSSQKDAEIPDNLFKVMTHLGVVKYLFVSIIISTVFVVMLEMVFEMKERNICFNCFTTHYMMALASAIVLAILLLIYFKIVTKNLDEDIHNLKSLSRDSDITKQLENESH